MLLHDISKPDCETVDEKGISHFHGHPVKSSETAKNILRRLKYDNDTIEKVGVYVKFHDERIEPGQVYMRRALRRIGEDAFPGLFKIWEADISAQSDYEREDKLRRLAANKADYEAILAAQSCVSLKTLAVSGKDLIERGVKPGPKLGELLSGMLDEVIEDPLKNDKEYLLNKYTVEK